jgi:long-chain acyl-CoA synthetase
VRECAVVGVPDVRRGERVVAFIVPSEAVSPDELRRFVRERLVSYQQPVDYRLLEALPRNTMGKVLKRVLRASWEEG